MPGDDLEERLHIECVDPGGRDCAYRGRPCNVVQEGDLAEALATPEYVEMDTVLADLELAFGNGVVAVADIALIASRMPKTRARTSAGGLR